MPPSLRWLLFISYDNGPYMNASFTENLTYVCPDTQTGSGFSANSVVQCVFITNSTTPQGTYSFKLQVSDNAATPEVVNSSPSPLLTLNTVPELYLFPTKATFETNQTETYTLMVNGGTGPFNIELFNVTGNKQQGSNVTVSTPAGSNSLSFYYINTTMKLGLPAHCYIDRCIIIYRGAVGYLITALWEGGEACHPA